MKSVKIMLVLMMISMPWTFFDVGSIGTFGLLLPEVMMMVSMLGMVYLAITNARQFVIPKTAIMVFVVATSISVVLSAFIPIFSGESHKVIQALKTSAHFLFLWSFALVACVTRITWNEWKPALQATAIQSLLIAAYGIYQIPARAFDLPLGWIDVTNVNFLAKSDALGTEIGQLALRFGSFYRATSIFSEPSTLALYSSGILSIVFFAPLIGAKPIFTSRTLVTVIIVVNVLALFVTFSLTGALLVGAMTCYAIYVHPRKVLPRFLVTAVITGTLLFGIDQVLQNSTGVSVLDLFGTRISNIVEGKTQDDMSEIEGESYLQRSGDFEVAFDAFLESPVLGVGPGNFSFSQSGRRHNSPYPSTAWGSVLAEHGIIGLCIHGALLTTLLFGAHRFCRVSLTHVDPEANQILPIVPFRVIILIFVGLTGNLFVSNFLWIEVAMAASILQDSSRRNGWHEEVTVYA